MDVFSWVDSHFNLIQTAGIIGGLCLTAAAARREAKAREIENLLTLSDHHRKLWDNVTDKSELQRILKSDVDVEKIPATVAEEVAINEAFAQYMTSWRIASIGGIITLKELATDVKWFFSLPLPHAVWEETKKYKNHKFVRFVKRAIEDGGRLRTAGD
jgi:hypothetical protein